MHCFLFLRKKNMLKFILFSCLFASTSVWSQSINYFLSMPKPQNHYFEVEMTISDYKTKQVEVKMPVWAPGSYLVREFAKNVNLVKALDGNGNPLTVAKTSKNSWKIDKGSAKVVKVKYEIYAFELSVRTSFLDLTHGFVSGSGIFMYVPDLKEKQGNLTILPFKDFKKITTSLPRKSEGISGDGVQQFTFKNYDELVDCPIEIGNQVTFEFSAANVKHSVAMYGEGNYDIPTLQKDMAKIVESATAVFGQNPNKEYVFIIHNVTNGQGGLEHSNSTTLSVNRWSYTGSEYLGFLSLVAHEYFHLWNVKRIRPIELGPFNYDEENYTSLLWVMEGFTSYYDELLLRRAGFYSEEEYLQKINSALNYVEGSEGSRIQPVAHASFDAWIKAYRPNENSANTTMTYYTRGGLLAALMDATIMQQFAGKKSLDHFLQALYQEFYIEKKRGFSEKEFEAAYTKFMGKDMSGFFQKYVNDTQIPDYKQLFEPLGISISYNGNSKPNFGASFSQNGGIATVKSIRSNSAAELAGLSVNDEIIGLNGYRISASELESTLGGLETGEEITLLIARDEVLFEIKGKMGVYERPSYRVSIQDKNNTLFQYWMRKN